MYVSARRLQLTELFLLLLLFIALQTMQQQLDEDSDEIHPTEFMFADGQELKIHIEAPGCQHALESSNKVVMTACSMQ